MAKHLNITLATFDITTTERTRHFLAQVLHESKTGLVEKYNGTAEKCVDEGYTVRQITRLVNGGYNGIKERETLFRNATNVIK